jgi:hypothetical protein
LRAATGSEGGGDSAATYLSLGPEFPSFDWSDRLSNGQIIERFPENLMRQINENVSAKLHHFL